MNETIQVSVIAGALLAGFIVSVSTIKSCADKNVELKTECLRAGKPVAECNLMHASQ